MKLKKLAIVLLSLLFSVQLIGQIKVRDNGYVGIGSTATPSYTLDVNGPIATTHYSTRAPFQISHYAIDPRLQSNYKIVFYNINSSGWIDIECKVAIEYSDSSAKENVKSIKGQGLDKVLQLRAVSYNWKENGGQKSKSNKKEIGFIAQEVERVIPEVVYTVDSTNQKLLAYTHIIPYLTEAIQELNGKIVVLESELKNGKNNTNKSGSINNKDTETKGDFEAKLFQNNPNPFNLSTIVKYTIPSNCQNATINIFDMKGTPIKLIELVNKGENEISIDANELKAGMYIYALIVDGQIIDSKNMILTN